MTPKVSVVIPTYNRATDLKRAIDSVYAQDCDSWEIVVVDNHSDDETDCVLAQYDSKVRVFKINNQGIIAKSRNLGIRKAKGEYIAFLDSDDWWKNEKLSKSIELLNSGFDVVYHDLLVVDSTEKKRKDFWSFDNQIPRPVFKGLLLEGNHLQTSSVVVKKSLLELVNGMSEKAEMRAWEDFDTWLEISKYTDKFFKINQKLGYYWNGGGNVSNPSLKLDNLIAFEEKFSDELRKLTLEKTPVWIVYSRLRAYYLLREKALFLIEIKKFDWLKAPFFMSAKILYMLFFLREN